MRAAQAGVSPALPVAHLEARSTCVPGDFNQDGMVTFDEVDEFLSVMLDPCSAQESSRCRADVNRDLSVDGLDVSGLVECLLHGVCP